MNTHFRRAAACPVVLLVMFVLGLAPAADAAQARSTAPAMSMAVSMERPTSHYYHIVFRADGLRGETQDLKMPVWRRGGVRETELTFGTKTEPTYKITPLADPTAQQKALFDAWLR